MSCRKIFPKVLRISFEIAVRTVKNRIQNFRKLKQDCRLFKILSESVRNMGTVLLLLILEGVRRSGRFLK
jgi:hypothetical protein